MGLMRRCGRFDYLSFDDEENEEENEQENEKRQRSLSVPLLKRIRATQSAA